MQKVSRQRQREIEQVEGENRRAGCSRDTDRAGTTTTSYAQPFQAVRRIEFPIVQSLVR